MLLPPCTEIFGLVLNMVSAIIYPYMFLNNKINAMGNVLKVKEKF